jgi:hypothetical protein
VSDRNVSTARVVASPDARSCWCSLAALQEKWKLTELLSADIERYCQQARGGSEKKDDSSARYSHSQQLETRLNFLDYLLTYLDLPPAQLDVIWKQLVEQPVVPADRELAFKVRRARCKGRRRQRC